MEHDCIADQYGRDHKCGVCGKGRCRFCGDPLCLRDLVSRPSSTVLDGVMVDECGRYLRAGELVATWIELSANKASTLRWALCMECYDRAYKGVNPGRITFGWLNNCIPCGYHSADIETFRVRVRLKGEK